MKRLVLILFLVSVCYGTPFYLLNVRGDTFTSHLKPITDGTLDIGTVTLYWRYIYGDAFTDGTFIVEGGIITGATWEGVAIDISDFTNLVAGTNITLVDDTLNVDDAFLINDGDDITTGTITAAGFTDGTFIVSGGIISGGEIVNTFGDIDIGGNTLTSWDIFTGQIVAHSTTDPQLLLRHTTGVDETGFYVDSNGDLTITPTGGDSTITGTTITDVFIVGSNPPPNITSAGIAGTITYDADYLYVCIANNSWKRVALTTAGWGVTGDTMIYEDTNTMVFEDGNTMVYD